MAFDTGVAIGPLTAALKSRIPGGTLIHSALVLHECFQSHFTRLMLRGIAQGACPLADHLIVGGAATRAANERGKWIGVLDKLQLRKPESMPQ